MVPATMGWPLQTPLASHVSFCVHGLPSSHWFPVSGVGVRSQPVCALQTCAVVHASLGQVVTVTLSHTGVPVAPLQNSNVHLLPSSGHEIVCVGMHAPVWQAKVKQGVDVPQLVPLGTGDGTQIGSACGMVKQVPVVHGLPVSQLPVRGVWTQPPGRTHTSSVHGLPSSQLRAVLSQAPVCGLHVLTVHASGAVQVTMGVPVQVPS